MLRLRWYDWLWHKIMLCIVWRENVCVLERKSVNSPIIVYSKFQNEYWLLGSLLASICNSEVIATIFRFEMARNVYPLPILRPLKTSEIWKTSMETEKYPTNFMQYIHNGWVYQIWSLIVIVSLIHWHRNFRQEFPIIQIARQQCNFLACHQCWSNLCD